MNTRLTIAAAVLTGMALTGCSASTGPEPTAAPVETTAAEPVETSAPAEPVETSAPAEISAPVEPPVETSAAAVDPPTPVSASNASRMARQYIEYTAFSPSGLVEQLEFEGFTNAEATAAVQGLSVDWSAQASRMAKEYLEYSAFSRSGLVDQLVYEGFAVEQANAAADSVGL